MTESEATRLVGGLMAAYRTGTQLPPATFDAYVEDIIDLPYRAAAIAIKQLRQTRTFLPSIAEIRAAATELTAGHLPDDAEAWAEVMRQIRAVGWCGTPTWSHPAIRDAVKAMGWLELCESTNQVADRAHFLQLYRTGRQRIERQRTVSPDVAALTEALAAAFELPPDDARELVPP